MKTYSFAELFLPSTRLVEELMNNPAEKANWDNQKAAAEQADTEGLRFKI